jgi:anaphase-promoting complex subunit 4
MEEDEDEPAMLVSVAEKALQQKCKPETLSYCPSMDLMALATEDEQLQVFRLNGQRVFGASYTASNVQISRLRWKPNGEPFQSSISKVAALTVQQDI